MNTTAIEPLVRLEVEDLYARHAELLDTECDLQRWLDLFVEDGSYRLISRESFKLGLPIGLITCENKGMLRDRIFAMTELMLSMPRWTRRLITNVRIEAVEDEALHVRASYLMTQGLPEETLALFSAGEYRDVIVRDEGCLRFREKLTIYDHDLIINSVVKPL